MPFRKPADAHDDQKTARGGKFPPEAYAYDSDITDEVVKRVQSEADKKLAEDEWTVIDGVGKQ
jgi:hypothetical protein